MNKKREITTIERICKKCGKVGTDHAFAKFTHRDGRGGRRNICKPCRSAYNLENFDRLKEYRKNWNASNRTKKAIESHLRRERVKTVINEIKEKTPCVDCGKFFPAVAMDFDHVQGKNKGIATMVSQAYKIDLILEEIKLCELICACCHRVRTHSKRQNLAPRLKK